MSTAVYPDVSASVISSTQAATWANYHVGLWQQGMLTPGRATTIDQFLAAEATFSGYAQKTVATWGASFILPGGGAAYPSPSLVWIAGDADPFVSNVIAGWAVLAPGSEGPGQIVLVGTFDDPIPITQPDTAVPLLLLIALCVPPA